MKYIFIVRIGNVSKVYVRNEKFWVSLKLLRINLNCLSWIHLLALVHAPNGTLEMKTFLRDAFDFTKKKKTFRYYYFQVFIRFSFLPTKNYVIYSLYKYLHEKKIATNRLKSALRDKSQHFFVLKPPQFK